jgi:hypothetical protein
MKRWEIKVVFDPTISFGAILNAVALLVGIVVAFTRIGGRIDLLAMRLGSLEEKITAHSDHDKRLAIVEERQVSHGTNLTTVQRDISDLRRGKGFVSGNRPGVDGEYDN